MKISFSLRKLARRGRSHLWPIGDVTSHMRRLTKKTARELDIQPDLLLELQALVAESCLECGLETPKRAH